MPKVIARLVRLWSVRGSTDPAGPHRWVVLSFIASTRVMLVAAGQLEDASDAVGYSTESATLACGVVAAPEPTLLQVTAHGLTAAVGPTASSRRAVWAPPDGAGVVRADVAADGTGLVLVSHSRPAVVTALWAQADGAIVHVAASTDVNALPGEVSCLASVPLQRCTPKSAHATGVVVAIGTHRPSLELYHAPGAGAALRHIQSVPLGMQRLRPVGGCQHAGGVPARRTLMAGLTHRPSGPRTPCPSRRPPEKNQGREPLAVPADVAVLTDGERAWLVVGRRDGVAVVWRLLPELTPSSPLVATATAEWRRLGMYGQPCLDDVDQPYHSL